MKLGFSTGCLYRTHDSLALETFDVFRKIGANAIELMWHEKEDELKLLKIEKKDLEGFSYVSLHAPALDNLSEAEIVRILEIILEAHKKIIFDAIVLHPYETMNWDIFKQYELPFLIENMDWRKDFGKYADSLKDIFEKFDVSMVLDLNHCFTNDPSMHLASDMHDSFGGRIKEIHLSGFETFHEPLFKTKQEEILKAIPNKNLPIIIESVFDSADEAKQEFEYVKNFLERK
jgi:hypothetical protein